MNRHRPTMSTQATGATLTEVLMSMMILSIGVLSVASLFPVGILSSARATQLTHAALLRQNAEAVLALYPNLIHDPDGDGNYREHNGQNFAVDMLGWARIGPQDTPKNRGDFSNTLQMNPQTSTGIACFWGNQPGQGGQFQYGIRRFHGFEESAKDPLSPYLNFSPTLTPQQRKLRPDSVIGDQAQSLVGSRDDWLELFRTTPTFTQLAPNQFQLTIDPSVDLRSLKQQWHAEDINGNGQLDNEDVNGNGTLDPGEDVNNNGVLDTEDLNNNGVLDGIPIRISLIDPEGRHSQVRSIPVTAAITPNGSGGGGTIGPLVFDTAAVNRITEIIVEVQNARFSWMMTVRKPLFSHGGLPATHPGAAAPASVDLVVFFQRPFGRANETFYQVESTVGADGQPGVAQFDDNGDGNTDDANEFFWADSDDRFSLKVTWNSSLIDKPPIASGRFVFDLKNGQWYRVRNIIREYEDPPNSGILHIEFTVDRPLPDPLVLTAGGMMFPKGIIAVFPLGTK